MIQSRFEPASLASDGYDVGAALFVAVRALSKNRVARQLSAGPEGTTAPPAKVPGNALDGLLSPAIEQFEKILSQFPLEDRKNLELAAEELERTYARPILEAPDGSAPLERARALASGYFPFLMKHFSGFFEWLNSQENRQSFLDALRGLRLETLLPDGSAESPAGRCLALMGRQLELMKWVLRVTSGPPDQATLDRYFSVACLADVLGLAVLFGIADDAVRETPSFASLARIALEHLLSRYAFTLQLMLPGLGEEARREYGQEMEGLGRTRLERLAGVGVHVEIEHVSCLWYLGDPVVGDYMDKVLRVCGSYFRGARTTLDLLSSPEIAEDRLAVRVDAGSIDIEQAVEARGRVRTTIRALVPDRFASFLSLDVRLS